MTQRLTGRKLMLTRSREDADAWVEQLSAEGAELVVLPCITSETIADPTLGARLLAAIDTADWLIFTSRRGVDATSELLHQPLPSELQIATVGAVTAAQVGERFGRIAHTGGGTAAILARELVDTSLIGAGQRCVLALAANAGDALERTLRDAGAIVDRFDVYRTIPAPGESPKRLWSGFGCDAVIFASPTAVTGFDNQVKVDTAAQMVTIGASTSTAVRELGWVVDAEAREPNLSAILDAMLEK
jgi:uroporphyrinogen-III synthase